MMNSSMQVFSQFLHENSKQNRLGVYFKLVVVLATILLNLAAFALFRRMKNKTYSTYLFISITLNYLLVGLDHTLPEALNNLYWYKWPFGDNLCLLTQLLVGWNFTCANDTTLILAVHRFNLLNKNCRGSERMTRKRFTILLMPWIYRFIYVLFNFLVNLRNNSIDLETCIINYEGPFLFIIFVMIEFPVASLIIILNIFNIYRLVKKRNRLLGQFRVFNRNIGDSLSKQQNCFSMRTQESQIELKLLNRSNAKNVIDRNNNDLARRITSKFNKDIKAISCILAIILNTTITNYSIFLILPYMFICNCNFFILEYIFLIGNVGLAFNPIILFVFHSSLRRMLWNCAKKSLAFLS